MIACQAIEYLLSTKEFQKTLSAIALNKQWRFYLILKICLLVS